MMRLAYKRAVLAALRAAPDFSQLEALREVGEADRSRILKWFDQSGLGLYLLSRLQEASAESCLPPQLLEALEQRLQANRARTTEYLQDFRIICKVLTEGNVRFVALKGFTLVPDFCPRFELRHQADIDLWVQRDCLENAISLLAQCGFTPRSISVGDHVLLAGSGEERVSLNESIYRPGRFRRLELHVSLLEELVPVNMQYPDGQWERARQRTYEGFSFCSLAPADMFIFQTFHAFKHLLSYWTRTSWLYEISRFLDSTHAHDALWADVRDSVGENTTLRDGIGLIVNLVQQLFAQRVSPILATHCLRSLPREIILWNRYFGERVALSTPLGNKVALLIQKSFMKDPAVWSKHFWKRLFPVQSDLVLTEICGKPLAPNFKDRWNQLRFTLQKARFHGSFLFAYPIHAVRWRFLRTSRGLR